MTAQFVCDVCGAAKKAEIYAPGEYEDVVVRPSWWWTVNGDKHACSIKCLERLRKGYKDTTK